MQVGAHGAREHRAGPIVAGEHHRALDRTGRDHHLPRPDPPEPLARQPIVAPRAQVVRHPLERGEVAMVVEAAHRRSRQHRHFGHGCELGACACGPVERGPAVDLAGLAEQPPPELRLLVGNHDARPRARRRERRREACGAAARHHHVAVRKAPGVAVRVGQRRRPAHPCRVADELLVHALPPRPRPHERLVVEPGREQRSERAAHRPEVERDRGPAVLAACGEALVELDHRGADIGLRPGAFLELHQRRGLLRAGGEDPARAMELEAARNEPHPIGEQRRGERVAAPALVGPAVEGERERTRAIDAPRTLDAKRPAHAGSDPPARAAS